jgi:hypothetical protein
MLVTDVPNLRRNILPKLFHSMIEAENFSDHQRTGSLSIKGGVDLITIRTRLGIYGTRGSAVA